MTRLPAIAAIIIGLICGQGGAQQPKDTLAAKADRLYTSARSAFQAGQWDQARGLLEQYVKTYSTHEYVPSAYLNLAYCRQALKDSAGYDEALEQVTKRFGGSPAWWTALAARLARAKKLKDNDTYLSLLEEMMRRASRPPLQLDGDLAWSFGRYCSAHYNIWRGWHGRDFAVRGTACINPQPGWIVGVVAMADTPDRARRALTILGGTFKLLARELPQDWQYTHVVLLAKAGTDELAQKTFDKYLQEWGDDPRSVGLRMLKIAELRAAEDPAPAEAAFDALLEKFPGAGSLEGPLWLRVSQAYRQQRYERLIKLAEVFLKNYTTSRFWDSAASHWVTLASRRISQKDLSVLAPTLKMLDEIYGEKTPQRRRNKLIWKMGLLLAADRDDQAAELAQQLIASDQWSAASFQLIVRYAGAHQQLAKVLDAARKQYSIPPADQASKASPLLNDLKVRLKDGQVRHAEEIGEQMYGKYPDAAATIEGVKLLADYYFQKLLPEPRDKWAQRMIKTYPRHPLTESVLANQITAASAAKKYERLAEALDTMAQSFPGVHNDQYKAWRVSCYVALQDTAAALATARKIYGPAAEAGDLNAIKQIVRQEFDPLNTDFKAQGDNWMKWAKQVAGTRAQLYCLQQALQTYYSKPLAWGQSVRWDEALTAMGALAKTALDPELPWAHAFTEVNMLAVRGQATQALKLLKERLKTKRSWRNLRYRLNLPELGLSLGRAKLLREGQQLAQQLAGACPARGDGWAIEMMLAKMYSAADDPRAAEHYLKLVKAHPHPARMYNHFKSALAVLREAKATKMYRAEVDAYLRRVPRVQEIVPDLLALAGAYYAGIRDRQALAMRQRLTSQYPASKGRDQMDAVLAKLRARPR